MDTRHHRRARGLRAVVVLMLAALTLLAAASSAVAAPTEPTLSLDELRAMLYPDPMKPAVPLTDCYMKTVLSGYEIEKIPVTVDGLVEWSSGSMILLESGDPRIVDNGGVAAGMSGSPVFVNDGGVDKLVGAVSYGDIFTLKGMALATPIEYMASVEDDYPVDPPAPGAYALEKAAKTGAGTVDTVVIARSQRAAKRVEATRGTTVMSPLTVLYIGGMPTQSRAYKELAAKLEKQTGLIARPAVASSSWAGPPAPEIEGGSSVCQIFSLGAIWYGAAGTATYRNGDHVVAFGHSSWWTGPCGAAMTAGWVTGVWPSTYEPYKMIAPRDVKGVITQDRNWGIAGVAGADPDWVPVNAHVSLPEDGRDVTTESSCVEWAFQTEGYQGMPANLIGRSLWGACDASSLAGSGTTVFDIVVSDETGRYTVHRENLVDSWDITWTPIWELDDMLWELGSDPNGVLEPRLESVDFDASISSKRISARFADIELPASGLHTGDNPIKLHFYGYGSRALKEIQTTLTLPEGKPLSGRFEASPARWSDYYYDEGGEEGPAPDTLADIVADLNARPKDSDVILTFYPGAEGSWGPHDSTTAAMKTRPDGGEDTTYDPVAVTIPTDWVFRSFLSRATVPVVLDTMRAKADYGQQVRLVGFVGGVKADIPVDLYRVDAKAGSERFVKTVLADYKDKESSAFFRAKLAVAPHNTTFVARTAAVDDWLPGHADEAVKVRPAIALGATVQGRAMTITAKVAPADTGGKIAIQRFSSGRWQTVKSVKVPATGVVKTNWTAPGAGIYRWRAKTSGSTLNAAGASAVKRVVIR